MPTQRHYDRVADELRAAQPLAGLWARSFSDAEGDLNRARALYIRYRADELAALEESTTKATQDRKRYENRTEQSLRQKRLAIKTASYAYFTLGIILILVAAASIAGVIDGQWLALMPAALFGVLGVYTIRKAREALSSLR